jgi:hypothetical protein
MRGQVIAGWTDALQLMIEGDNCTPFQLCSSLQGDKKPALKCDPTKSKEESGCKYALPPFPVKTSLRIHFVSPVRSDRALAYADKWKSRRAAPCRYT